MHIQPNHTSPTISASTGTAYKTQILTQATSTFTEAMSDPDELFLFSDFSSISHHVNTHGEHLQYGEIQLIGRERQKWIAGEPHNVPHATVSMQELLNPLECSTTEAPKRQTLKQVLSNLPDTVELPGQATPVEKVSDKKAKVYIPTVIWQWREGMYHQRAPCWSGVIGPDSIFIKSVKRPKSCDPWWSSELTRRVYEKHFDIAGLKYVHMRNVGELETLDFIINRLYTPANGLSWPDTSLHQWRVGTPEFQALLGTSVGGIVAYLVLGAYEAGTRRITSIWTWSAVLGPEHKLQMRFDIEPRFVVD